MSPCPEPLDHARGGLSRGCRRVAESLVVSSVEPGAVGTEGRAGAVSRESPGGEGPSGEPVEALTNEEGG